MAAPIDTTPAARILERVVGHVVQSINDFNKILSPRHRYTQKLTELTAQLDRCMARLYQPRSQPHPGDVNTTEDEIVQYASEIKALRQNGLRDFENAYQNEVACVLQTVTDLLTTTIHPSYVKRSLQKIATGELKPYFPYDMLHSEEKETTPPHSERASAEPGQDHGVRSLPLVQHAETDVSPQKAPNFSDPWLDDRLKRRTLSDGEQPPAKRYRFDNPDHEPSTLKAKCVQTNTAPTLGGQQREETSVISPCEASASQFAKHGGTARNDHSADREQVAFQITDADNQLVAVLEQAGPWGNKRVDAILHAPVRRTVKLRRGHGFDQRQLNAICDPSDKDGVKIVACRIQACGGVMHQSCVCCKMENSGPFETCIMVDDELFPQCGNCAWNRQLCRGALMAAEEGASSEARPAPEGLESTEKLKSSVESTPSEHFAQRTLVSGNAMPGHVSPGRHSQSDTGSTTTSFHGH